MAFLQNLVRNHQEAWWDKLFRFSPEEFFKKLVPVLDLPDHFTVGGCVLCPRVVAVGVWGDC